MSVADCQPVGRDRSGYRPHVRNRVQQDGIGIRSYGYAVYERGRERGERRVQAAIPDGSSTCSLRNPEEAGRDLQCLMHCFFRRS